MINPTIANQMHNVILMLAKEIREEFDKNNFPSINLQITVSGRTNDELKLTYRLTKSEYGSGAVEGGHIDRVLMEVVRREHWQELNASLSLPKPCDSVHADSDF